MRWRRNREALALHCRYAARLAAGVLLSLLSGGALALAEGDGPIALHAARLFDGTDMRSNVAALIGDGKILEIGPDADIRARTAQHIDLGDATILPGFIELHAHIAFRHVPQDVVLRHGVTTARDLGGPLAQPTGGKGALRLLSAGPIITVQNGYPISIFGKGYIAEAAQSPQEARALVRRLIEGGAAVIKIALEPGGEVGAPWSRHHDKSFAPWPTPSLETVSAIVDEAHRLGRIVTAHLGEAQGAALALAAGVDEWAHAPCAGLDDALLARAVRQKVRIVTTLDTLSHCPAIASNLQRLAKLGASFLYGAEIAHDDIPWGIDAQELRLMRHLAGMSALDVLRAATSQAGAELGLAPLGTLTPGAPADVIAVRGDPLTNLKTLEYPDLVISGGVIVAKK